LSVFLLCIFLSVFVLSIFFFFFLQCKDNTTINVNVHQTTFECKIILYGRIILFFYRLLLKKSLKTPKG
jgi:hypothetical protein